MKKIFVDSILNTFWIYYRLLSRAAGDEGSGKAHKKVDQPKSKMGDLLTKLDALNDDMLRPLAEAFHKLDNPDSSTLPTKKRPSSNP